jgi:hypothetical protein
MHPDLLRALAQARHEDLLNDRPVARATKVRRHDQSPRFARSRRKVGSLLIGAGSRLIGARPGELELVTD